jgi:hypothetical protein
MQVQGNSHTRWVRLFNQRKSAAGLLAGQPDSLVISNDIDNLASAGRKNLRFHVGLYLVLWISVSPHSTVFALLCSAAQSRAVITFIVKTKLESADPVSTDSSLTYEYFVNQEKQQRKQQARSLLPIRLLRLFCFCIISSATYNLCFYEIPFDVQQWKKGRQTNNFSILETQFKMANNLVRWGKLEGFTQQQVVSVLGQPDGIDKSRKLRYAVTHDIKGRPLAFLIVTMNEKQCVASARISPN